MSTCTICSVGERAPGDSRCRPCNAARARARRSKMGPADWRRNNLWAFYKITPEQYDSLLAAQGGGCAVCSATSNLCVDHDHACCAGPQTCGRCIRGILCRECNRAEGMVGGDPERLRNLANYIEGAL